MLILLFISFVRLNGLKVTSPASTPRRDSTHLIWGFGARNPELWSSRLQGSITWHNSKITHAYRRYNAYKFKEYKRYSLIFLDFSLFCFCIYNINNISLSGWLSSVMCATIYCTQAIPASPSWGIQLASPWAWATVRIHNLLIPSSAPWTNSLSANSLHSRYSRRGLEDFEGSSLGPTPNQPSQFSRWAHLRAWPVGQCGGNQYTSICLCQHPDHGDIVQMHSHIHIHRVSTDREAVRPVATILTGWRAMP